MTKDEILNMEAGREMDALIAISLFDWRWMKYPAPNMSDGTWLTGIFPPDKPGRWPVPNFYNKIWVPSDDKANRFSNWDQSSWWDNDGKERNQGLPYYSTDIAAAWMVVEKITDPYNMTYEMMDKMVNTKFGYWWDQSRLWAMTAKEAAEAICRAALLAILDNSS
jgi:hypothetical protein